MLKLIIVIFLVQLFFVVGRFYFEDGYDTKKDLLNDLKPWQPYVYLWERVILPIVDKFKDLN